MMRLTTIVMAAVTVASVSLLFAASAGAVSPYAGFGVQSFEASATVEPTREQEANGEPGAPDVQAGSHPYAFTNSFVMNEPEDREGTLVSPEGLKTVSVALPPGFVGNPNAVPRCPYQDFVTVDSDGDPECPDDTQVGWGRVELYNRKVTYISKKLHKRIDQSFSVTTPLYNIVPQAGVAALFGFVAVKAQPVLIDASVRTGSDYGITETSPNNAEGIVIMAATVRVWGVPASPSHDRFRGDCLGESGYEAQAAEEYEERTGKPPNPEVSEKEEQEQLGLSPRAPASCPVDIPVVPLLTNPTSCGEPREVKFSVDGWNEPAVFDSRTVSLPPLQGCEKLDFSPTLAVEPDGGAGSTPTGLNVGVHVNQESTSNPDGLGEADVKDTTVALPPGVQISPSAADGLQACSGDPADLPGTAGNEIGFTGFSELDSVTEPGVLTPQFTPRLPGTLAAAQAGEAEPLRPGVNFCPDASKIANVHIKTPLLEGELTGAVYLAAPQNFTFMGAAEENPFKSLIAMYLVAEERTTGVLVKLPAEARLCEAAGELIDGVSCQAPGQIITTFKDTPQTPFSDLQLEFYGTDRAPLATPALCGTYNTSSSFTPWSAPDPANPDEIAHPPASFQVTSGPNGAVCSDPLPFSPALASGTTNINAGSFSPLTTTISREDGQQSIQQVTLRYPPGVTGILAGVPLCPEAQANAGTCPEESRIGETIVSVGLGSDPFSVTGGKVYLTEKYDGAPFGLSIVNPAKAGPFDLQEGRPVIVRAKIEVNPITAALTITTDSSGEHAIPSIIDGIPLQIKHVNVNITRSGFTFNPTNCDPTEITGTVSSAEGASSPVKIPFQVTNCAQLKFAPKFSVSTSGKTSKAEGASLTAKVTYPYGPQGTYADVASVKVELPKQLPSRLTTLQKACTAAQFNTNPAGCPAPSVIGHAVVHTPLLPVPLEGPAYFVSNGGEAFPNLIMVLQGYGVKIDLVGDTFISKAGITSTTFKTVPDQPFSSFELTLGEGPYSALAANGNLCALTTIKTIKKKVTVKARGRRKTVTRKIKETEPATLQMPNEFVGQNGATVKQTTTIAVTGCVKAAAPAKKKTKKAKAKRRKK